VKPSPAISREVPPQAVSDQLEKILGSEIFSRSERLCVFLRFVVGESLAGRGDTLKEQVLAAELYGKRPGSADDDPIVRVDARRLRDKLREFYAGAEPGARFAGKARADAQIRTNRRERGWVWRR
jgi:hypothetical protein